MAYSHANKLIINYLPQSLTDGQFDSMFRSCGDMVSAKIMRDQTTGYSYGYGFVEYSSKEDCDYAIQKMNGHKIEHKTLKVAFSKPTGQKNTNLFIAGIGPNADEEYIKQLFQQHADIVHVRLLVDKATQQHKGTGFVLCTNKEGADVAIEKLNGYSDGAGMSLTVKLAQDSLQQRQSHPAYHNYLQQKAAEQVGSAYGQGFGQGYGQAYGQGYYDQSGYGAGGGYGGVDPYMLGSGYGNVAAGGSFKQQMPKGGPGRFNPMARPYTQQGPAPGVPEGDNSTLFVYNISPHSSEQDLYKLFGKHCRVLKVDLIPGKDFCFVHVPTPDASHAIGALNGSPGNNGKPMQVKLKQAKQ